MQIYGPFCPPLCAKHATAWGRSATGRQPRFNFKLRHPRSLGDGTADLRKVKAPDFSEALLRARGTSALPAYSSRSCHASRACQSALPPYMALSMG
jgi:hypothetical protein